MRWERLFADAEAQLDELRRCDLDEEVVVKTRAARKEVRLQDRLRRARGGRVDVRVHGAGVTRGRVGEVGPDWFLLDDDGGGELLIPLASTLLVSGLGSRAVAQGAEGRWVPAMDLRHALSVVSWDRSHAAVTLADGSVLAGMIDRVGADAFDLVPRLPGEPRYERLGEGPGAGGVMSSVIPFAALGLLRRL